MSNLEKQLKAALDQNHLDTQRKIQVEICVASPHGPANDEIEQMRDCYAVMKQCYTDLYSALQAVRQKHKTSCSGEQYADLAGIMREIAAQCEDLRKEFEREINVIEHIVVERWSASAKEPQPEPDKYVGRYFRAYPQYQVKIYLPRFNKDPEKYKQWVDWLGFPEWMQDKGKELYQEGEFETCIFTLNFDGIQSLFEKMRLNNQMPPPFILEGVERLTEPYMRIVRIPGRDIL